MGVVYGLLRIQFLALLTVKWNKSHCHGILTGCTPDALHTAIGGCLLVFFCPTLEFASVPFYIELFDRGSLFRVDVEKWLGAAYKGRKIGM